MWLRGAAFVCALKRERERVCLCVCERERERKMQKMSKMFVA